MSILIIYPIFFFIMLYKGKNRREHWLYNLLILFFMLAGITSVYISSKFYTYHQLPQSFLAICYHLILLCLLISPMKLYDKKASIPVAETNSIVSVFTAFIIIIFVIYILDGIQYVNATSILNDVRGLRMDLVESNNVTNSIYIRYVDYIVKSFSYAPLALMFYFIVKKPDRKLLIAILFLCSIGLVVVSLRFAAREFLIKYLFVAFFLYFISRKHIPNKWKKNILLFGVFLGVISVSIFLLISFLRFEDVGETSTFDSLCIYFGQPYAFFSEGFLEFPNGMFPEKGTLHFPLFAGKVRDVYNLDEQVSTSIHMNVFRTTVGSWVEDCGIFLTVIITIIYAFIIRQIGRLKYQNAFTYIYLSWVFEFMFSLLFFFEMGITAVRFLMYLLTIFLDVLSRKHTPNKQNCDLIYVG